MQDPLSKHFLLCSYVTLTKASPTCTPAIDEQMHMTQTEVVMTYVDCHSAAATATVAAHPTAFSHQPTTKHKQKQHNQISTLPIINRAWRSHC
jgi:hypothetical protein